ncbi:MAG: 16S rRNA (cytidine(1402)-2'-O)-methyltransferase [bacterium]
MGLYIVATPIGNLEDITLRALRVLKEADIIACEDTRRTRKLLSHYDIHTPLTSYYQHNRVTKGKILLEMLEQGKDVALVTDAGTPGISDPGFLIIKDAVGRGLDVVPVPGPCALITALVASGLPTNGFVFMGFLPRKKGKIKKELEKALESGKTVVFYESPYRIVSTLSILKDIPGDYKVVVAREMTKKFEEILRGRAEEILAVLGGRSIKGEIVVVVSPL